MKRKWLAVGIIVLFILLGGNTTYGFSMELICDAGGPYYGVPNEVIQFMGTAYDGMEPYSWYWDFGDGAISEEQNPTHAYAVAGLYNVTLTVTDVEGTTASNETTARITTAYGPRVSIYNITGGYGVHATLINNYNHNLKNITWSFSITGGIFGLIHKIKNATIPVLYPNQEVVISSGIFFGWGSIDIYVMADYTGEYGIGYQRFFRTEAYSYPSSELVEMMPK